MAYITTNKILLFCFFISLSLSLYLPFLFLSLSLSLSIYIYIYILSDALIAWIPLTLSLSLSLSPSVPISVGSLDGISCPHRAEECNCLLVRKHCCVHEKKSFWKRCLWFRTYISSRARMSCLSWMGWKMGGEWSNSWCFQNLSKTARRSFALFLSSFFFFYLSLKSNWYNHTLVLTWLQRGRISVLFNFHDNLLIAVYNLLMHMLTSISVDEMLLSEYMDLSNNFTMFILTVDPQLWVE